MSDDIDDLRDRIRKAQEQELTHPGVGEVPSDAAYARMDKFKAENEHLRARVAALEAREKRLVAALEFYADRSGRGRDYVVVKRGETDPIETVYDMGHRARAELKNVKGNDDE